MKRLFLVIAFAMFTVPVTAQEFPGLDTNVFPGLHEEIEVAPLLFNISEPQIELKSNGDTAVSLTASPAAQPMSTCGVAVNTCGYTSGCGTNANACGGYTSANTCGYTSANTCGGGYTAANTCGGFTSNTNACGVSVGTRFLNRVRARRTRVMQARSSGTCY